MSELRLFTGKILVCEGCGSKLKIYLRGKEYCFEQCKTCYDQAWAEGYEEGYRVGKNSVISQA
jgi:hypothetical protein